MAHRAKAAPPGNRKLTDYFSRSSQAGSSQPPSSPPAPTPTSTKLKQQQLSQQPKALPPSQQKLQRKGSLKTIGTSASKRKAAVSNASTPSLSLSRSVKTERTDGGAFVPYPTPTTPKRRAPETDVIIISSGSSSEKSHITISSDSSNPPSIISITSSSSVLEPTAVFDASDRPPITLKATPPQVTSATSCMVPMRTSASCVSSMLSVGFNSTTDSAGPLRRKSPRVNAQNQLKMSTVKKEPLASQQAPTTVAVLTSTPRKGRNGGRKRRSEFSDDENLDLKGAKDVIVTTRYVPGMSRKGTPMKHSSSAQKALPSPSPPKKSKLAHDIHDTSCTRPPMAKEITHASVVPSANPDRESSVIPSSQSDEQELVVPRNGSQPQKKDINEVHDAILAWRTTTSSQRSAARDEGQSESSWRRPDGEDEMEMDVGMDMTDDVGFGPEVGAGMDVEADMGLRSSSMQISVDGDMGLGSSSMQISTSPSSSAAPLVPSSPLRCSTPVANMNAGRYKEMETSPVKTPVGTPTKPGKGTPRPEVVVTPLSVLRKSRRREAKAGLEGQRLGTEMSGYGSTMTATTSSETKVGSSPALASRMENMAVDAVPSPRSSPKIDLIDEKSKTAALIAQIKAEALSACANTGSLDEEDEREDYGELGALSSESDEEFEFDLMGALRVSKAKGKKPSRSPITDKTSDEDNEDEDSRPTKRRRSRGSQIANVRNVSPSPSPTPIASTSTGTRRKSTRLSTAMAKREESTSLSCSLSARMPKPTLPPSKLKKSPPRATTGVIPFAALLKEKDATARRMEKHGIEGGATQKERKELTERALQLGERFLRSGSEESLPGPSNAKVETMSPRSREKMARRRGVDGLGYSDEDDSEPDGDGDRTFENVMDVAKRADIFKKGRKSGGAGDGDEGVEEEALGRILRNDRAERGKRSKKGKGRESGVPLWVDIGECEDEDEDADANSLLALELEDDDEGASGAIKLLRKCIDENNVKGVATLLQFGRLLEEKSCQGEVLAWVFDLALTVSPSIQSLAQTAYTVLLNFCLYANELLTVDVPPIRFESIYFALNQLGASPEVLRRLSKRFQPTEDTRHVSPEAREDVLCRLVELVEACACAKMLHADDIPEIVAALLLCGHDPFASEELKIGICQAVEKVVNAYCEDGDVRGEMEIRVCKAVFVLTREYDVEDKLSLLALIPGGTYLVRRVAQWIAFGYLALDGYDDMLVDRSLLLPPLHLIVALLPALPASLTHQPQYMPTPSSPSRSKSCTTLATAVPMFDITKVGNVDTTNYVQLGDSIGILSEVLTNVHVYAALERTKSAGGDSNESPAKSQTKSVDMSPTKSEGDGDETASSPSPILTEIAQSLQRLSGKIVDTRGVALDRSRAKAAIQQLQMRIHYQSSARSSGPGRGKQRDITSFYTKRPKVA